MLPMFCPFPHHPNELGQNRLHFTNKQHSVCYLNLGYLDTSLAALMCFLTPFFMKMSVNMIMALRMRPFIFIKKLLITGKFQRQHAFETYQQTDI